jgi:hypothetical protein
MLDDDLSRQAVPVSRPVDRPTAAAPRPEGRAERAEKFKRRVMGLAAGRWEVILTVDEHGVIDWSFRPFGKVER